MHQFQYIDSVSGNISARLDNDRILTTPSGLAKGFMEPEQLVIVNLAGEKQPPHTDANLHLKPTSELPMHLEVYKQRPDVNGVVHAHPPVAVALTLAGISLQRCIIPEAIIVLGLVPTTPYATPSGQENRDAIAHLIQQHDAILLSHHGSLTVAADLWGAYLRLESLEHVAKIIAQAEQLGGVAELPPHQVRKLLETRRAQGLWRDGDEERFAEFCGC